MTVCLVPEHLPGFAHLELMSLKNWSDEMQDQCNNVLEIGNLRLRPHTIGIQKASTAATAIISGNALGNQVLIGKKSSPVAKSARYHLTLVSRANLSPISSSTTPFKVSFKLSSSFIPFVVVSTFEPSWTRTEACSMYVPDGSSKRSFGFSPLVDPSCPPSAGRVMR